MDDLKVYAGDKDKLGKVVDLVDNVSVPMGMNLGLRKRAVAHMIGVLCAKKGEDLTLKGL